VLGFCLAYIYVISFCDFKNCAVGELTSPRIDPPRVGLSANCPVSLDIAMCLVHICLAVHDWPCTYLH